MRNMLKFLKDWTLPVAMLVGIIGYPFFLKIAFIIPYLIFFMLLLTFSKVPVEKLELKKQHFYMLAVQIGGALLSYYLLAPFNEVLGQVALVCFVCPSATAAAVITGKLDGDMNSVTTYTFLSNTVAALSIPLLFSVVGSGESTPFMLMAYKIFCKVFPLLIIPFFLAWLIRLKLPRLHTQLVALNNITFYMWAVSLSIAIAKTVESLRNYDIGWKLLLLITLVSGIVCFSQFFLGRKIGASINQSKACGQALGQKNTILAIWLAYTYLNPLTSIGPGAYIFLQNGFNAYQIFRHNQQKNRK